MDEDEIYEKVIEFVNKLKVEEEKKDGLIDLITEAIWNVID